MTTDRGADTPSARLPSALQRLEQARCDLRERTAVAEQRSRVELALTGAERRQATLANQLSSVTEEVRTLEGPSFTGFWASVRGSRDERLEQARSEVDTTGTLLREVTDAIEQHRSDLAGLDRRAAAVARASLDYAAALLAVADGGDGLAASHPQDVARASAELERLTEPR